MRSIRFLFISLSVMCALSATAFAQPAPAKTPYDAVMIERFAIAEGVEFPENDLSELMTFLVLHFNKSKRFDHVFLSTDAAAQTAPARRAKITGVVTKYSKGSRAARYLVGFGAGRTKLVADIKVSDAETGQVLIEQKVDGHVYGGLFGGETDAAKGNLASDIIKSMFKQGYAGERKKDK